MTFTESNTKIENNHLKGQIIINNENICFDIDPEKDAEMIEEFEEEISSLNNFSLFMSDATNRKSLISDIVTEIIDSIYEQDLEDIDIVEEKTKLRQDLHLKKIDVYPDTIMLIIHSPANFPNMNIYVQLDETFGIDDITVN